MANEFCVMEQRCEMCKTYAPCADCDMVVAGTIIARFPLCIGCQEEMKETYKDALKSTAEKAKDSKMKEMVETKHDLLTTKYTQVLEEKEYQFNAPHNFEVVRKLDANTEFNPETDLLARIHFQEGPIKENGVNGVANEDLLVMVIRRLQSFQGTPFACRENAMAITKLEEALMWLRKRTMGRENRGVEGTNVV